MKTLVEKMLPDRIRSRLAVLIILPSVIPLVLLIASWQFAASVRAMNVTPDGSAYLLVTAPSSIDGVDCITADDADEEPLQAADSSSDPPYDPERDASVWADKASIPSRSNQGSPWFPGSSLDAGTLCSLGIVPILLLRTQSFYCLHEHIRERAPPTQS